MDASYDTYCEEYLPNTYLNVFQHINPTMQDS